MPIQQNFNLQNFNTLNVSAYTDYYYCLQNIDQLKEIHSLKLPIFFLGGGSNLLFSQDYQGTILHNCLKGIEIIEENDESILVRAFAGENWHQFVLHTLNNNWFGLECLSYIPGTVGASPVQNIGAYGVEVCQLIDKVNVYNITQHQYESYTAKECQFGYRNSIFKKELQDRLVVSVEFKLLKNSEIQDEFYPALKSYLEEQHINYPSAHDIRDAVIAVRQSKLPEVGEIGSAGSFFKNPIVSKVHYEHLALEYPNLVAYAQGDEHYKLSAGQLIDMLGFKGCYENNVGMYAKQALILVNLGGGTGQNLLAHAQKVKNAVREKFDIDLEPEVIIL